MNPIKTIHTEFMKLALAEAKKASVKNEVPVGAVVVVDGKVVARAHNMVEGRRDPTAHAELLALKKATKKLKNKYLPGAEVYSTIEPCTMCAGAMVLARISGLHFGAREPKTGAAGSVMNIASSRKLNHRIKVTGGIMEEECAGVMKEFFRKKRKKL